MKRNILLIESALLFFLFLFLASTSYASIPTSNNHLNTGCGGNPNSYCVYSPATGGGQYTTDYSNACWLFCQAGTPPSCVTDDWRYMDISSSTDDCKESGIGGPYRCCAPDPSKLCQNSGGTCGGTAPSTYYNSDPFFLGCGSGVCWMPESCQDWHGTCIFGASQTCPSGEQPAVGAAANLTCTGLYDTCCLPNNGTGIPPSGGVTPAPTPPPPAPPYGSHDSTSCTTGISGWACDNNDFNNSYPLYVDIYRDGPAGTGTYTGEAIASTYRSDLGGVCGGTFNHGFTIPASKLPIDGQSHSYYAYAVNTNTGLNALLSNSPQSTTCSYSISGNAYIDYNHDGVKNGGDYNYINGSVRTNTFKSDTTDSSGNYSVTGLTAGTYTMVISLPVGGWESVTTPNATVGPNQSGKNVSMTPLYTISGSIFTDNNENQTNDTGDASFTNGSTIAIAGPVNKTVSASNGAFTSGQVLTAGTYTVTYNTSSSPLPDGYKFTTPQSFSVTLGNPASGQAGYICNKGSSLDASCGNPQSGSISNLDFGVTNNVAWNQSVCLDVRDDNQLTDQIPASPSCGGVSGAYATITQGTCSTGAGIVYSCNNTPDFGLGSANSLSWQAGGATSQECFTGPGLDVIRTSYSYLDTTARQSNITPIDMNTSGVCGTNGTANCTLDPNLEKGVYSASGDVYLNSFTFPAPADPATDANAYIFMINGNLHILGNIIIPKGSVAVFSASGNIYVDKSVGQDLTNPNDPSVNTPDMEGIYSADQNFIIQSYASGTSVCNANGTPIDKKLNVLGVVITNASKGGGGITNNRDLCQTDLVCPTFTTGDGINAGDQGLLENYLLSLLADGKFVTRKLFNWQEIRP